MEINGIEIVGDVIQKEGIIKKITEKLIDINNLYGTGRIIGIGFCPWEDEMREGWVKSKLQYGFKFRRFVLIWKDVNVYLLKYCRHERVIKCE